MNRPTLLIVDDDPHVRAFYHLLFTRNGYDVLQASNAFEGLRTFRTRKDIDAVVSDYEMPGMNGAELASEVKACNPRVPFVLVSGCESVLEEAPHFVDAAVAKGAPIGVVLEQLRTLLGTHSEQPTAGALSRYLPVGSALAGIALAVRLVPKLWH